MSYEFQCTQNNGPALSNNKYKYKISMNRTTSWLKGKLMLVQTYMRFRQKGRPVYFKTHGKEAWCCRRHGHTTALLSQISGAPPGCLLYCCSQVSHHRCVGHGEFLSLGNTQMEAVVDRDHLRKNPHSVSHLPLKMKQRGQRAYT